MMTGGIHRGGRKLPNQPGYTAETPITAKTAGGEDAAALRRAQARKNPTAVGPYGPRRPDPLTDTERETARALVQKGYRDRERAANLRGNIG